MTHVRSIRGKCIDPIEKKILVRACLLETVVLEIPIPDFVKLFER